MATIQFNGEVLHYVITDSGDGSASLQLFADREALDLYVDKLYESGQCGDLSEGGGSIDQADVDNAMTVEDVEAEFE